MFMWLSRINTAFALKLNDVMSWNGLPAFLLFISVMFWMLHWSDPLMLILTIQTSIDAAATKAMQNALRHDDEARIRKEEQRDEEWRDKMEHQTETLERLVRVVLKGNKANSMTLDRVYELLDQLAKGRHVKRRDSSATAGGGRTKRRANKAK